MGSSWNLNHVIEGLTYLLIICNGNIETPVSNAQIHCSSLYPFVFLSCKANAKVKLAKMGHGPHCSTLVVIYVVRLLFVFYVLFVYKCVLPPGDNPIAVSKYISYHILCV
jgi:hypothetical protein